MKMDRISIDLGLDMTLDALITRAEQLIKLEADALADRSTHVYNLQRKVGQVISILICDCVHLLLCLLEDILTMDNSSSMSK